MGMKSRRHCRGRKGSLEETISFAMHGDDPRKYIVLYRDKDTEKEAILQDFMQGEEYSVVPFTRIVQIRGADDTVVWKKGQKEVLVKKKTSD